MFRSTSDIIDTSAIITTARGELNYSKIFKGVLHACANCNLLGCDGSAIAGDGFVGGLTAELMTTMAAFSIDFKL